MSHREYAGAGSSTSVLRCAACGHSQRGSTRLDHDRVDPSPRAGRHQPIDEGPPSNPVIDPDLARRLLEELGG
jgi:hypothetical protein